MKTIFIITGFALAFLPFFSKHTYLTVAAAPEAPFIDSFRIPKGETLNVKDFGAAADNIHDDGPAIQKALDKAIGLNGATVFFPDGIYLVADPGNGDSGKGKYGLRIGSNTTLLLSQNAVLHKRGNEEIISNKDPVNGNKNILITGGTFKSDSGTDQKWAPTRTGIKLVNVSSSQIKNCSFRHIGNSAISIEKNSVNNIVSFCRFTDIFNCAVELNGSRNTARNNYLYNMGSDGILVNGDECLVSKNRMVNIGKYSAPSLGSGISLGVDNHSCKNNKVLNNTITGAAAYGIINDRSANTLIEGNIITNTGNSAIKVGGGGLNSVVSKNIIKNTGLNKELTGVYVHTGIVVDGTGVTIVDNSLKNVTGTGVYINTSASNSVVKRTRILGVKNAPKGEVKGKAVEVKATNVTIENYKPGKRQQTAVIRP